MKKSLKHLSLFAGITLSTLCVSMLPLTANASGNESVTINETNFPDANFRKDITKYDTNGDNVLSYEELGEVTDYSHNYTGSVEELISDFTGIEYFYNLEYFAAASQKSSTGTLDLSHSQKLLMVNVHNMKLTSLKLPESNSLYYLSCGYNKLTSLDVSGLPNLEILYCDNNQLNTVNLADNHKLYRLDCRLNPLNWLDISSTEIFRSDSDSTYVSITPGYEGHTSEVVMTCMQYKNCMNSEYSEDFDYIEVLHEGPFESGHDEYRHYDTCKSCGEENEPAYHMDLDHDSICDSCNSAMPSEDKCYYVNIPCPNAGEAPSLKKPDGTEYENIGLCYVYNDNGTDYYYTNDAMKAFYKENSPDEYLRIISNTFDTFEQDNTYLLFVYVFNSVQGYPLYLNGYGERLEYSEDFNLSFLYEASYYECESHTHTYEKNVCSYCHSFQRLAAPAISSLSNSASGITVKWNPVNNAKYYKIMRKEGSGKWTSLATVSTNSYTDTSAVSGKTYTYQIACVSESDKTTVISDTTGAGKSIACVKQPTTTVANAATGVKVTWTKSAGATGYIVYRKTASTSWQRVAEISGDSTLTATDTTAASGTTYYYTVKAYKTVGSTTYNSTYVSTKALAYQKQPTTTVANAATGVKITWTKSAGATGYIVYRKTASTSWARVTVISGDSTLTTTDTKAVSGTTYYYTVKAYKTVSSTTYNSTFASSKAIVYQKQPTTTVANAATGVKISWTKSAGATGYIVYRKTASTSWARVAVISGDSTLTTTDTSAASGTTYYYTVKAYKTVSGTTYNSTFASTAALMYLKQPTVTLANVTGGVKVTWTKSTGATSYRVYRKTSGGSWTTLTTLGSTATTYTDKTAKSGTTYYYTVKAITGSYASSFVTTKYIKKN